MSECRIQEQPSLPAAMARRVRCDRFFAGLDYFAAEAGERIAGGNSGAFGAIELGIDAEDGDALFGARNFGEAIGEFHRAL